MRYCKHILLFSLMIFASPCMAQMPAKQLPFAQVKLNDLIRDTQRQDAGTDSKRFEFLWWMPREYWEVSLAQQTNLESSAREKILDTLGDYDIVAVAQGTIAEDLQFRFSDEPTIRDSIRLFNPKAQALTPLREDDVPPAVASMLAAIKPILSSNLGPMGKSMYFMVFPGLDRQGLRLIDPLANGHIRIETQANSYNFRLPLGSLLPGKTDPTTGDAFPGDYLYNPYTGSALKAVEQQ